MAKTFFILREPFLTLNVSKPYRFLFYERVMSTFMPSVAVLMVTWPQDIQCSALKVVKKRCNFQIEYAFQANVLLNPRRPVDHHRVARHTLEVPGGPSDVPQLNPCVSALPYDPTTSRTYRGKSILHNHARCADNLGVT